MAVSAPPTSIPRLFSEPGPTALAGPPNVPKSTNLYRRWRSCCCPCGSDFLLGAQGPRGSQSGKQAYVSDDRKSASITFLLLFAFPF